MVEAKPEESGSRISRLKTSLDWIARLAEGTGGGSQEALVGRPALLASSSSTTTTDKIFIGPSDLLEAVLS